MIVITLIIFLLAMQVGKFQNSLTKVPPQLQADFISLRFINSPACFAYQNEEKTHPGIIDLEKFNEKKLQECYPVNSKKEYNFGLKLKKEGKELKTKKYYLNNRDFTLIKSVLVKKGDKLIPDLLEIAVQVKI